MKIGVYIGSFNPVHLDHEEIANNLLNDKTVDKIVVVPTSDKYHLKSNLVSFNDRYKMLELAFKGNENVVISDIEREEYHYTYQNMAILKEKYKSDELYLIIGADNLFELNTWKNYIDLLNGNSFIVFGRNDLNIEEYININFTNWKNKFIIKEPVGNLSSTLIRESVKEGNNLDGYLSASVRDYILEKHLYKGV